MLAASGGTTPYTWSLVSGTLPADSLSIGLTGELSGTPTAAANAVALTFKATDSSSPVETASVTLDAHHCPGNAEDHNQLGSSGQAGTPYSQTLTATGGTAPYSWLLTSGALPAGLELNAQTGILSGTPTAAANATPLTFKVTYSGSPPQTSSVNLTLRWIPYSVGSSARTRWPSRLQGIGKYRRDADAGCRLHGNYQFDLFCHIYGHWSSHRSAKHVSS